MLLVLSRSPSHAAVTDFMTAFETIDEHPRMARAAAGDHWTMGSRCHDSVAGFGICARSGGAGQARAAAKRPPESDRTRDTSPKPSDAPTTFRMTSLTSAVRWLPHARERS